MASKRENRIDARTEWRGFNPSGMPPPGIRLRVFRNVKNKQTFHYLQTLAHRQLCGFFAKHPFNAFISILDLQSIPDESAIAQFHIADKVIGVYERIIEHRGIRYVRSDRRVFNCHVFDCRADSAPNHPRCGHRGCARACAVNIRKQRVLESVVHHNAFDTVRAAHPTDLYAGNLTQCGSARAPIDAVSNADDRIAIHVHALAWNLERRIDHIVDRDVVYARAVVVSQCNQRMPDRRARHILDGHMANVRRKSINPAIVSIGSPAVYCRKRNHVIPRLSGDVRDGYVPATITQIDAILIVAVEPGYEMQI